MDIHVLRNGQPTGGLADFIFCQFASDPGDAGGLDTTGHFLCDVAGRVPPVGPQSTSIPEQVATIQRRPGTPHPAPTQPVASDLVTFAPQFGTFDPGHGIAIGVDGAITAQPNPSKRLDNFLIIATVTRTQPAPPPPPAPAPPPLAPLVLRIRVHLHEPTDLDTTTLQLTPAGLTVRPGGGPIGFSIVGEFGLLAADLTYHRPTWRLFTQTGNVMTEVPPGPNSRICTVGGLTLDQETGSLRATAAFPDNVFVSAQLPDFGNVQTPTQQVIPGPAWNTATEARWMGGAGPQRRDDVVNLIVLPDGFQAGDETTFFELVQRIVDDLRTSKVSQPFNALLDQQQPSVSIYAAFVPSREAGSTVAYEVVLDETLTQGSEEADTAPPDPGPPRIRSLPELLYVVGTPTSADIPAPGTTPTAALAAAINKWTNLYGTYFTQYGASDFATFHPLWVDLARRGFALERDTAFGVRTGLRPNAQIGNREVAILQMDLNELRPTRADLNLLLGQVFIRVNGAPTTIGARWTGSGRDRDHVAILVAGVPNVGTVHTTPGPNVETMCVGLGAVIEPVLVTPAPGALRLLNLNPGPVTAAVDKVTFGTFHHEFGHLFELGEEYGGGGDAPAIPPDDTLTFANAVFDGAMRGAPTDTFNFNRAPWGSLMRIRVAGVLAASPVATSATGYDLTLRPGNGTAFAGLTPGTRLFLRGRPLMEFIRERGATVPVDYSLSLSPPLKFNSVAGDVLSVDTDGGGNLPTFWNIPQAGTLLNPIVFAPRLHPTTSQVLPLLSPVVATHINSLVPPTALNRDAGTACQSLFTSGTILGLSTALEPPTHLPNHSKLSSIINQAKILGLYDAGAAFDCGAYHASGYCTMRMTSGTEISNKSRSLPAHMRAGAIVPFCHVCQYLIVDFCDPTLHGRLDDSYAKFYLDPP